MRTALVASAFGWFWLGATLFAWLVLPIVALFVRGDTNRVRVCQRLLSRCFRLFHAYLRVLRLVDARLDAPIPESLRGGPVVLVANHTTLVDMTAIMAHLPNVCCVAKPVYASSPFVGRILRMCGFIDAGKSLAARADAIELAMQRLAEGFSVLVFPEGTRSPEGGLHPFHRGAFAMACRAGAPVVPLVLRCEPHALGRGRPIWAHPDTSAQLSIVVRNAVEPAEFQGDSRKMRDVVEGRYREWLGLRIERQEQRSRE
jgi:1-acyl-sn-glycerol-3-phosphate acyltransferase